MIPSNGISSATGIMKSVHILYLFLLILSFRNKSKGTWNPLLMPDALPDVVWKCHHNRMKRTKLKWGGLDSNLLGNYVITFFLMLLYHSLVFWLTRCCLFQLYEYLTRSSATDRTASLPAAQQGEDSHYTGACGGQAGNRCETTYTITAHERSQLWWWWQ